MTTSLQRSGLSLILALAVAATAAAQGVTTSSINGVVMDATNKPVAGALVTAVHQPSGTTYTATSREDGRFTMLGMRVGGPYKVTASGAGLQNRVKENVYLALGVATDLAFDVREGPVEVAGETITVQAESIIASDRTGAATFVSREALATLPTISGRLESMTRLTPQSGGGLSFAGADSRLNNITVDGSSFNNSFGLGNAPGDRTQVAPISLAAIEQIQVNVAPYDVRQGNFVGAGVNTVTRSGTNSLRGSFYRQFRDNDLVGTKAGALLFNPGSFSYGNTGGWAGGAIRESKLFFFTSIEDESLNEPGTTFRANQGGETVQGSVTRVLASDLVTLSNFLNTNFDYVTGPFEGYQHATPATRFMARGDWNVNDTNKVTLRYTHLNSFADILVSNSSSLGVSGNRRTNTNALNFQNSNYKMGEYIRSFIGEWNSIIGGRMANSLIAGYTHQDESRESRGEFFPMVDILNAGTTYTTFGFEPFTPNNELRYNTFQLQDTFTKFGEKHTLTFGGSLERYRSENIFFPGSQSAYTYNSLADFFTDANDFNANPNRTTSPVSLRRFQIRWANIPGMIEPIQILKVTSTAGYVQDDWQILSNMKITAGLRFDVSAFGDTGIANSVSDALFYRDADGNTVQFPSGELPDPKVLWSPRVGFNWDVRSDRRTQIRGGTGVFTGRPAYVWISNQIGNNGVLTGFEQIDNTFTRPFHPDPNHYKPPASAITGAPASSFALELTDPEFKFPQVWRTNIAVDQKLPWGLIGTLEYIYNQDVNGLSYINANLIASNGAFVGADDRPRFIGNNRINNQVTSATVLQNQNVGRSFNIAGSVERPFRNGLYLKSAYSYGEAKNVIDPGSIASGSFTNNPISGQPNDPNIAFASASPGHRYFLAATYTRTFFRAIGPTTMAMFWEGRNSGNTSYTFSGDLNGDSAANNDLVFIHRNVADMNFQAFTDTASGKTFSAADQAQAWDAYIAQDKYLSQHRGGFAERGAVFLPFTNKIDLSLSQDLFTTVKGRRHAFQFRADILNLGNLLNSKWGVGERLINAQPLIVPTAAQGGPADAQGRAQYRMRVINGNLMTTSLEATSGIGDVWRVQFSLRYTFN